MHEAESWVRDDELKARELFQQAAAVDGTEPITLSRYLEFEIAHSGNDTIARLATPLIRSAIERCRKQIEARVNLPGPGPALPCFLFLWRSRWTPSRRLPS